jgi:hypothetical protein
LISKISPEKIAQNLNELQTSVKTILVITIRSLGTGKHALATNGDDQQIGVDVQDFRMKIKRALQ